MNLAAQIVHGGDRCLQIDFARARNVTTYDRTHFEDFFLGAFFRPVDHGRVIANLERVPNGRLSSKSENLDSKLRSDSVYTTHRH